VDFCYGKIASAKVPRYVIIVDELPISGRGKVQKFRLTEIFKKKIENGEIEKLVPTAVKNKKK
jgi:acyl-CoA synthetase (AMP-forming)/AMP-acid ligase II